MMKGMVNAERRLQTDIRTGVREAVPTGTPEADITRGAAETPTMPVPDENDPEVMRIRHGRAWKNYLIPEPEAFKEQSGIGDWCPGAENDTPPDGRGPKSETLRFAISSAYSGHPTPPTPEELYRAFHTTEPTNRTRAIIEMWMTEASSRDVMDAWIDHCYTWHQLAKACERHNIKQGLNAPIMNMMAGR